MPSSQKSAIVVQVLIVIATALVSIVSVKTSLQDEAKFAKERNDAVNVKIDKVDDRLDTMNYRLGQIEGRLHITR